MRYTYQSAQESVNDWGGLLVSYRLSVEKNGDVLSIKFQPVEPSSRRGFLLVSFAIDAVFLLVTIFLWSHWWARIFFPFCIVYGMWGTYRKLNLSEEVNLSKDAFRISKFSRGRRVSTAECKPWFLTNVRYRKRGHNSPSSISCCVEARFKRFAEGISASDAYSIFYALLVSGFLPNDSEIHFPE